MIHIKKRDKIIRLRTKGMQQTLVAKEVGVCEKTVYNTMKRYGFNINQEMRVKMPQAHPRADVGIINQNIIQRQSEDSLLGLVQMLKTKEMNEVLEIHSKEIEEMKNSELNLWLGIATLFKRIESIELGMIFWGLVTHFNRNSINTLKSKVSEFQPQINNINQNLESQRIEFNEKQKIMLELNRLKE